MTEGTVLAALLFLLGVQYFFVVVIAVDAARHGVERGGDYAWAASYLPLVGLVVVFGYLYDRDRLLRSADAGSDEK